ncbi:MAG: hypothetical protein NC903_03515, partial [Candidatus Omnitrophica bacterium]|nr:hypothetical protein [Candidatus Omnitrophota bacterium]
MKKFNVKKFIEEKIRELKPILNGQKAISATSGGVDSTTATVLVHRVLRDKLKVIFIDDGLMRQDEFSALFAEGRFKRIEFFGKVMEWHTRWT